MVAYTTITTKGQITVPIEIRQVLNITAGKKLKIVLEEDRIVISKPACLDDVRRRLQSEMAEHTTASLKAQNGDGWTAHVTEAYGERNQRQP